MNQGKILAQELSKAFGMALPQEVVAFTIADEEKPDRRTKGLTFIVGDELHLILEELRKPSYSRRAEDIPAASASMGINSGQQSEALHEPSRREGNRAPLGYLSPQAIRPPDV